ncbi:MAG TPA: 16S rRNA (cytidine(1402)-2'-O)-methyltransferase [Bacteroidales bacterium]|nr:16S rRNA (cytidine(1402)-2'-O)-methyltransferase [Bacteroidales bacterium]HPI67613.1 16S rRNA (cytidine(1402)-2'-O)-methyltransferase [Bacteroidales bacterium]HPR72082.1 16S rRNA (cytidine(1402)-2'-O)-methyltransferase [Bacteroidales bacterium]
MSKLFLVPTPVGNFNDITFRALEILGSVDLILAEDTRQALKLLNHFNIRTALRSHHMFNEHKSVDSICKKLLAGDKIALISDAGTPGISDPGFLLVRTCLEQGIDIETLPGATALIPALVNSGLPCDRFCFEGFLPVKKGRNKRLVSLEDEPRTMIFYESPYRLIKTLNDMVFHFGSGREASVSRELSKIFEETIRGTLSSLIDHFSNKPPKGEIVVVVKGSSKKT